MRALYTLVRTLPVWHLRRKLRKSGSRDSGSLKLGCRLSFGKEQRDVRVEDPLCHGLPNESPESFTFEPIQTPLGSFQTSVVYRRNVDFSIADKEAMLSIDEDFFRPNRTDAGAAQRPGSVPVKASDRPLPTKSEAGSLSSGRLLNSTKPPTQRALDAGPSSSLTAAMKAAEITPAFIPPLPHGPIAHNSALTARLNVAGKAAYGSSIRRPSSDAVPFPSQSTPPSSDVLARTLSSSPCSGPSSSIGVSQRNYVGTGSPRSPSLTSSSGNVTAGPTSSTVTSGVKPVPVPTMRRYSSSRTSRSYGYGSGSPSGSLGATGGGSLLGAEISSLGRRGSRLSLEGPSGSPLDIYAGTSWTGRLQHVGGPGAEEKSEINDLIAMIDSGTSLQFSRTMSKHQADETLKKLATSFHSSDPGTLGSQLSMSISPDALTVVTTGGALGTGGMASHSGGGNSGSPLGRPSSWRMSSLLSGRPTSALDGLREEDEPRDASAPKHQVFVPSSLGKYGSGAGTIIRSSSLSGSPGSAVSGGGVLAGSLPRYVSKSKRGRIGVDTFQNPSAATATTTSTTTITTIPTTAGVAGLGSGLSPDSRLVSETRAAATTPPPSAGGLGSSFDDGLMGQMEMSFG